MSKSKDKLTTEIQADFDRIALLPRTNWNHNSHYHGFLMKHIPAQCTEALDIGCGTGSFTRLLAARSDRVLALDLSPQMIRVAKERSRGFSTIDFQVADVIGWEFPTEQFDCIVSIATLHHLPIEETLRKMKNALKSGGALVVLDLFQEEGLRDTLASALAVVVNAVLRLMKNGQLREARGVREAWVKHGERDSYSTLSEVRRACADVLPEAKVRKHLLWRYSVVWGKA